MIPDFSETVTMIERDLPGWTWLIRNNHDPRGKYFCHVHGGNFNEKKWAFESSSKVFGDTAAQVVWEAYQAALETKARLS